jgi:hypothetical protein
MPPARSSTLPSAPSASSTRAVQNHTVRNDRRYVRVATEHDPERRICSDVYAKQIQRRGPPTLALRKNSS